MTAKRQIERRKAKHSSLVLEHSFLFRIPPRLAWPLVFALTGATALAETVFSNAVWFGPAYLAIIALAAWSLSARTGIALGLAILAVKLVTGTVPYLPVDPIPRLETLAVRVISIMIVVSFIGMARKSCEQEWRSARTDQLTGALNRQAFFELVENDRGGGWRLLIYADLDGLKKLNDVHGHAQGDESLKAFAETVRKTIRDGDAFARMGGDEFVIFMNVKDEASGTAVAGRLHQAINVGEAEGLHRLSCSLGVLVLPNGPQSIDDELRAADALMYQAKQTRSGIMVATATEGDDGLVLGPSVSILGMAEREGAVRQSDRSNRAGQAASDDDPQPPESRAAA